MTSVGAERAEFLGWPPSYRPDLCPVFAHNETEVGQSAERLWGHLVNAGGWPGWYANARGVRFEHGDRTLRLGATFHWRTFATEITSFVDLYSPPRLLGWSWYGATAQGYHVWSLEAGGGSRGGTRVVTEETQRGPGPAVLHPLLARALWLSHEVWLESLRRRSARGPAPQGRWTPRR